MARLLKQTYTELLPKDCELIDKNGKQFARFRRRGKLVDAPLTKNGHSILRVSSKYYGEYRDENGRLQSLPLSTDRSVSEHMLHDLLRRIERIRNGLEVPEKNRLDIPIEQHLESFKKHLLAKGTSKKQVREKSNRIRRIIEACGFSKWNNITGSQVERFLTGLRDGVNGKPGRAARTVNGYLEAIKHFCSWLQKEKRAPYNPVAHLCALNVNADRRHVRRPLTIGQCRKLLARTKELPVAFHMSGAERSLLYRLALESGLRANEIMTLIVGRCNLRSAPPTLTVKAGYRKQRKERTQPIPPELAAALSEYIGERRANELLFPRMPHINKLAMMLRRDLEAAGIPYQDDEDRVVDFHALRHTYATNLARSGVHPKIAMDLLGHSNINLTMAYYSHTDVNERAVALNNLPDLSSTDGLA